MKFLILFSLLSTTLSLAALAPFERQWMNHEDPSSVFKSKNYPDSIFVLEGFFNGCNPCNINAPLVDSLADEYAHEPRVHVVDMGVDRKKSEYSSWISKHRPNHPVLNDGDQLVNLQLGSQYFPSTYVLDCKGNIVASTVGTWGEAEMNKIRMGIDSLLKSHCE